MNIIRHINSGYFPQGCIATIGNFDGVHCGHRALLKKLQAIAQDKQLPAVIILFEPQPIEFLYPDKAPARLTKWREKVIKLMSCELPGISNKKPLTMSRWCSIHELSGLNDENNGVCPSFHKGGTEPVPAEAGKEFNILTLKFNNELANLTAIEFIQQILIGKLNIKYLLIGSDFKFGKDRSGNIETLQTASKQYEFMVETFADFNWYDERVSSTRIREALATGKLELAADLLGRPYSISGRVIYGAQRGRTLGFPTANIALQRLKCPLAGVYVVIVSFWLLADSKSDTKPIFQTTSNQQLVTKYGVANLGTRPTVDGKKSFLEVYIFDFDRDIYGRQITVEFLKFLRSEQRFDSLQALKDQINIDVKNAKNLLFN